MTLDKRRPYTFGSPLFIPFREIMAWCRLYGIELLPWEMEIIDLLDEVRMECYGRAARNNRKVK